MINKPKILILYNLASELKKGIERDLECEREITIIVPLVKKLLTRKGYRVDTLETTYNLWEDLKKVKKSFDLVLNFAEAFGGTNKDETLVPAMLEALNIPFTGASSSNMQLTLDKEKSKLVCAGYGIKVPPYQLFRSPEEKIGPGFEFPLIVKPIREEGSIGIYRDNVVVNNKQLKEKITHIIRNYYQPVLVEKFIIGREISVGVIGNYPTLHVFPPLEFSFDGAKSSLEAIRSYEYKWESNRERMTRARLGKEIEKQLIEISKQAFISTECRDYARFDYRLSSDNEIFLLEVNYNPGIGPNAHGLNNTLTKMASFEGISFENFVETIVLTAATREGLI